MKSCAFSFAKRLFIAVSLLFVLASVPVKSDIIYDDLPSNNSPYNIFPTNKYASVEEILNYFFLSALGYPSYFSFGDVSPVIPQEVPDNSNPSVEASNATNRFRSLIIDLNTIYTNDTSLIGSAYSHLYRAKGFIDMLGDPVLDFSSIPPFGQRTALQSPLLMREISLHNQLARLWQNTQPRFDLRNYAVSFDNGVYTFYDPWSLNTISSTNLLPSFDSLTSDSPQSQFAIAETLAKRGEMALAYALLENPEAGLPVVSTNSPFVYALRKAMPGASKEYTDINDSVATNEIEESSLLGYTWHIDSDLHEIKPNVAQMQKDVAALLANQKEREEKGDAAINNITNQLAGIRDGISSIAENGGLGGGAGDALAGCFWGEDWSNYVYNASGDKRLSYQVPEGNYTLLEYLSSWKEEFENTSVGGSYRMRQFMGLLYTQSLLTDDMRVSFASVFAAVSNLNASVDVDMQSIYSDAEYRAQQLLDSVDYSKYGDITNAAVAFVDGLSQITGVQVQPQKVRLLLDKSASRTLSQDDLFDIVSLEDSVNAFSSVLDSTNLFLKSFEIMKQNFDIGGLRIENYTMEFRSANGDYYSLDFDFKGNSNFSENAEKMRAVVRVLVRIMLVGILLFSTFRSLLSLTRFMMGNMLTNH